MMLLRNAVTLLVASAHTPAVCGQERTEGTAVAHPPNASAAVAVLSLLTIVLLLISTRRALSSEMPPPARPDTLLLTILLMTLTMARCHCRHW